jgi:hypothetical protein
MRLPGADVETAAQRARDTLGMRLGAGARSRAPEAGFGVVNACLTGGNSKYSF